MTGGGIGFVDLVGDDVLLHDIAISEMGWNQCLVYDKTGHRRPRGNFDVHGLYGSVINSEKSFFTNDPQSHSDSIGVLHGHPPITSFLGVPLVLDGKTMGMIGVANREGGYSCEQQEDLEEIAPAVMQALQRKRSEEALREAYDDLHTQSEELQAQSEELQESNEALLESEECERARLEELTVVLDSVPAAIWIAHDPQALHITGNRLSYEWLQIPEGANASKSAPEEERPETFKMFKEGVEILPEDMPVQMSVAGTEIRNYEFDFVYPDGRVRHVLGNARPLRDKQGNPRGSVSAFIDITERKRAEQALSEAYENLQAQSEELQAQSEELQVQNEELQSQSEELHEAYELILESENKFRTLAENSPDLIARFDRQNRCLYANPAIAKFYNCSPDELIGKTNPELRMDPEMAKFSEKQRENVFTTGKNKIMEFHHTSPQGKEYYFNTQIVPEIIDGKITSVLAISRDITDIIEAEIRLKETLDSLEVKVKERTAELEEAYNLLKESEKGLAEAQRMAHLGNWDWNIVTNGLYWYDEIYRIFGLHPQEFGATYDSFLSYVHPDDRDYLNNSVIEALNGRPYSIDHRIILATGEERVVHEQGEVIFDEKNIPIRMKGTVQDITENKKAEEMLKESEGKLKALFELLPVGVSIADKERNILDVNLALENILGLSRSDLLKGMRATRKYLRSDGTEMPVEEFPSVRALKEEGSIQSSELGIIKEDCSIIWTDVSAIALPFSNGQVVIITRDITESKKAEEKIKRLANIVESSDDAIVTESFDGIITSWNKGAEQIYGYLAEEVLGKNFSILEPDNLKGEIKQFSEKIKQGKKIQHYETLRLKKDGTIINVSVTLSPVFGASGEPVALSAIVRDITENVKAKEALRLSNIYNRSLIEASLDPLVIIGHDGKITDVNTSTEFVTGYSRDELIGTDFANYFTEPEKAKKGYKEVFNERYVSDYALEIRHRNGSITPVLYNASV